VKVVGKVGEAATDSATETASFPGETKNAGNSVDLVPASQTKPNGVVVKVNGTALTVPKGGVVGSRNAAFMDEVMKLQGERDQASKDFLVAFKEENEALKDMARTRKAASAVAKAMAKEEREAVFGAPQ
jgi:hypothetical protein